MAILPWFVHQAKHVYTSKENMVWDIWYKSKNPQESTRKGNKPQVPPQAHKCSLVERLCKDVCKLILGRDMTQHNGPFLHIVSQEMIPHLYVFGCRMKHWVFRYAYGTGAIWGPCVVRGPVDGRFLVWWLIDNVVWTDSWLSIAGAGCGLTGVGAGEEQARKVVAGEASRCGEDK
jgi:hypothetical protein